MKHKFTASDLPKVSQAKTGFWAEHPRAYNLLLQNLEQFKFDDGFGYAFHAERLSNQLNVPVDREAVRSKLRTERKRVNVVQDLVDKVDREIGPARKPGDKELLPYKDNDPLDEDLSPVNIPETISYSKEYNWRDKIKTLKSQQVERELASGHKTKSNIVLPSSGSPIAVVTLADLHMGASGTNYSQLVSLTDEILSTPNLFVILAGDLLNTPIKLRGVKEVQDDLMDSEESHVFLESWLKEMSSRLLASCWDNHTIQRQEEAAGYSSLAALLGRYTRYGNGIYHLDVDVGTQRYTIVFSHRFRVRSNADAVIGQKSYIRNEAPDREIAIAGDSHTPGIAQWWYAGKCRTALNTGTITGGEYSERGFSLITNPVFPCFTLDPREHIVTPYQSVRAFLLARSQAPLLDKETQV